MSDDTGQAVLFPELLPQPLTTDEALAETAEIMERAIAEHQPSRRFLLFSGGNDSLVILDALALLADEIVHVNTGIGIPETTEFARRVAARYDLPFIELHPPETYESLVLGRWDGLPGPGAHRFTYQRLKERPIEALLRAHRRFRGERFMLLTGVRRAESKRRMGYADPVNRRGGQVWVNPLLNWSNESMREYRQGESLPVNEVSVHLHMSGECLCGAMADQGPEEEERAQIRFFYPDFDRRLCALEKACRDAGKTYTKWGVKRKRKGYWSVSTLCAVCDEHERDHAPNDAHHPFMPETTRTWIPPETDEKVGPMCSSCEFRQELDFGKPA